MQDLILGVAAAFVGIFLGFWLRGLSVKGEKAQWERRAVELSGELVNARADFSRVQTESATRAGFQALASERERTLSQLVAEQEALRAELHARNAIEAKSSALISQLETELRNERQNLAEKLSLLDSSKQALANQFEALAGEILEKKSKSFSEGSQKELSAVLNPLKTQIEEFRKRVEEAQTDSKTGVAELRGMIGNLDSLNKSLAEEARNLATALRGSSKTQGDWGEFILRDLLEKAGLREGEQFSFQQSFAGVEGENGDRAQMVRTDVILNRAGVTWSLTPRFRWPHTPTVPPPPRMTSVARH